MSVNKSIGWLIVTIGVLTLVLIVPAGLVAYRKLPITSGGIEFSLHPLTTTRNADGSYTTEVQVSKDDQWSWNELDVRGTIVSPNRNESSVRVISELPVDPVPDQFVLRFKIDEIDDGGEPVELRVKLRVNASTHGGLSGGSRSKSRLFPLELANDERQVEKEASHDGREAPASVITDPAVLEDHLGETVQIRGKLKRNLLPSVLGVELSFNDIESDDMFGKQVVCRGKLTREVVSNSPPKSARVDGTYYALIGPSEDEPVRITLVEPL